MKISLILVSLFLVSLSAQAYEKNCSSFDGNLKYHFDSPDGGAPRPPNESLLLNGQDIPEQSAFIAFDTQPEWESKPDQQGDYVYTKFVVGLSVSNASDLQIVFQDLVFCQTIHYTGDPLP